MSSYRHSFSFIISSLIFIFVGFSFFLLAQKVKKPKKTLTPVIRIAIITPVVKKIIEKKPLPPIIVPLVHIPPKIKKKIKPKKVIKKRVIKKKVIKKKIHKKKRVRKKVVKKKKIIKKYTAKKKIIRKKVIKKIEPVVEPIIEPIREQIYIPTPQPKRVVRAVIKAPIKRVVPKQAPKIDKSAEKQQFLSQVRSQIIANKKYPKMALRRHIQGAVKVKFDITSSGEVSNIHYLNGKTILQKGAKKAIEKSFPITVPSSLKSELTINDIYLTIHFNIH